MKWEKVKLKEIALAIQTGPFGSQLHQSDYSKNGIPVVMPKDLLNGKISEQSIARVSKIHVNRLKRHIISNGDILYSRRGDVGRCAYATEYETGWLCGTGCLRVTINTIKANSKFIFYQLQQPSIVGWVQNHAVGSTMLNLNTAILSEIPLLLPTLCIQTKIADILSAYDELIKNNQKQIKLLEEAAQRLYKEWFVDLRFPGCENTPIIDGVPEGWGKYRISEIGKVVTGKTPSTEKEEYYGKEIPFVKIPDMYNGIYSIVTETSLTKEGADTQKSKYIPANSIMVSCIATVGLVNISVNVCQTNQQINTIILNQQEDLYYLYFTMKRLKTLLEGVGSNGATMTNVNKTKFENLEILYPIKELRKKYFCFCYPIFKKIYDLSMNNIFLSQARDCLLTKLMSGELEVQL